MTLGTSCADKLLQRVSVAAYYTKDAHRTSDPLLSRSAPPLSSPTDTHIEGTPALGTRAAPALADVAMIAIDAMHTLRAVHTHDGADAVLTWRGYAQQLVAEVAGMLAAHPGAVVVLAYDDAARVRQAKRVVQAQRNRRAAPLTSAQRDRLRTPNWSPDHNVCAPCDSLFADREARALVMQRLYEMLVTGGDDALLCNYSRTHPGALLIVDGMHDGAIAVLRGGRLLGQHAPPGPLEGEAELRVLTWARWMMGAREQRDATPHGALLLPGDAPQTRRTGAIVVLSRDGDILTIGMLASAALPAGLGNGGAHRVYVRRPSRKATLYLDVDAAVAALRNNASYAAERQTLDYYEDAAVSYLARVLLASENDYMDHLPRLASQWLKSDDRRHDGLLVHVCADPTRHGVLRYRVSHAALRALVYAKMHATFKKIATTELPLASEPTALDAAGAAVARLYPGWKMHNTYSEDLVRAVGCQLAWTLAYYGNGSVHGHRVVDEFSVDSDGRPCYAMRRDDAGIVSRVLRDNSRAAHADAE